MARAAPENLAGLAYAYRRLDCRQREAVDSRDDTVVLAGPGSGKTDTLAVKGAILLTEIRAPRGVACITYTRAAAREIQGRIRALGVRPRRTLFAGTVHAFCFRGIIRPFAAMLGETTLRNREVIAAGTSSQLWQQASQSAGFSRAPGAPRLQWMRRTNACGDDLSEHFDDRDIDAMQRYERLLVDGGFIDFDGMIHEALRLVREYPRVSDLLAARYPWLLVDEYQDLGGPLHQLVQHLRTDAAVRVFAVGDPDQTIMQFTGADSRFLETLPASGYHQISLRVNYRSGRRLIEAAASALLVDRRYEPDPSREDEGEVLVLEVDGGISAQARSAIRDVLPAFRDQGYALHEIAVLYPQKSWLLDSIVSELDQAGTLYSLERDARFGQLGDLIGWLQRCAQWALDAPSERATRFRELSDDLREYLVDARQPAGHTALGAATLLFPALEASVHPDTLLLDWLTDLMGAVDLERLLDEGNHAQDQEALRALLFGLRRENASATVQDFAGPVRRPGRVVVTTYHSSKGRQFDVVILPGLQDGVMPRFRKTGGHWRAGNINHDRNLFYVALTRARHSVALLWSQESEDAYGDRAAWPPSRFLAEIRR